MPVRSARYLSTRIMPRAHYVMAAVLPRVTLMRSAGAFDLRADSPTRDEHRLPRRQLIVKHGHGTAFHAHRAAPAPDVARDVVDVGNVDHGHALDALRP